MANAEMSMNAALDRFVADVRARLERGRATYGDRSFARDPAELLHEIDEELLDVCGWSFILRERLRGIERALGCLAAKSAPAEEHEQADHARPAMANEPPANDRFGQKRDQAVTRATAASDARDGNRES